MPDSLWETIIPPAHREVLGSIETRDGLQSVYGNKENCTVLCLDYKKRGISCESAALSLARDLYLDRHSLGMTGQRYLLALRRLLPLLQGLLLSKGADVLSYRIRARALGCTCRASRHDLTDALESVTDRWREELGARIDVVETHIEHLQLAGPIGRTGKRYEIILADPPWQFEDQGTRLAPGYEGTQRIGKIYDPLPLPEIEALGELIPAAGASLCFLWASPALIAQNIHGRVLKAWNFEPKTIIPWIKLSGKNTLRIGGGHYTRGVSELLVIGSRGRGASLRVDAGVPGVILAQQRGHSAKPFETHALIERLCGPRERIELFARSSRAGWDVWGDEAPGEGTIS